jgi:hypothetical protein
MEPGESAEEFMQDRATTEAYPRLAEMLAEQVMGKTIPTPASSTTDWN